MTRKLPPEVYTNEYQPWYGVLVSEATKDEAEEAVRAECMSGLPLTYLGIMVQPLLNEYERPGRRRRFHVFTDEPQ